MSVSAVKWALYRAPYRDHSDLAVLLVIADKCGPEETTPYAGAYPSRATIAKTVGMSVRTVHRRIQSLLDQGLIRQGDQRLPYAVAPDKRRWERTPPTVYDVCPGNVRSEDWADSQQAKKRKGAAVPQREQATPRPGDTTTSPHDVNTSPGDATTSPSDVNGSDPVTQPRPRPGDVRTSHKPADNHPGTIQKMGAQAEQTREASAADAAPHPRPESKPAKPKKPRKKPRHQMPEDWEPRPDVREQMTDECPDVDQDYELLQIRDCFIAKGQTSTDWNCNYRRWIREEQKKIRQGRGGRGSSGNEKSAPSFLDFINPPEDQPATNHIACEQLALDQNQEIAS